MNYVLLDTNYGYAVQLIITQLLGTRLFDSFKIFALWQYVGEEHFARVVLLEHAVNISLSLRTHGAVIISNPAS